MERINIDTLPETNVNWLDDGERANAVTLNRPIKQVAGKVNELADEVDLKLNISLKGAVNGLAELNASGQVPVSQLPSYVDDVLEYADFASFPVTGETAKIYVDIANNKIYRWSGSTYVEIVSAPYAMDQNVTTTSDVTFAQISATSSSDNRIEVSAIGSGLTSALRLSGTNYAWDIKRPETDGSLRFHYVQDALDAITVLRDGNVGVGTASPQNTLHVAGVTRLSNSDGATMLYVNYGASTGNTYTTVNALIGSGAGYGELRTQGSVQTFYIENTERMRIDSSGNVGIGTSSPTAKLDVNGAISATGNITSNGNLIRNGVAGMTRGIQYQTSGSLRWQMFATSTAESGSNAGSDFSIARYNDAGSFLSNWLTVLRSSGTATITGNTNVTGAISATGNIVAQGVISSSGANQTRLSNNAGIAQVWGLGPDVSTNGTVQLISARSDVSNGVAALTATQNGVDVTGAITATGNSAGGTVIHRLANIPGTDTFGTATRLDMPAYNGTDGFYIQAYGASAQSFATEFVGGQSVSFFDFKPGNGTHAVRMLANGNVHIGGTSDPGVKLGVTGNIKSDGLITSKGTLSSVAHATPTTVYTLPAGAYRLEIMACILNTNATLYGSFATVVSNGSGFHRIVTDNGVLLTITLSGSDIQVQQNSGTTQTITWGVTIINAL